jgi:hypothetical protein
VCERLANAVFIGKIGSKRASGMENREAEGSNRSLEEATRVANISVAERITTEIVVITEGPNGSGYCTVDILRSPILTNPDLYTPFSMERDDGTHSSAIRKRALSRMGIQPLFSDTGRSGVEAAKERG